MMSDKQKVETCLYNKQIFREAVYDVDACILENGEDINNIRYSNDKGISADSLKGLQSLMKRVTKVSHKHGLERNTRK